MRTKHLLSFTLLALLSVLFVSTASAQFRFGLRGGVDVYSSKLDKNILNASNRLGFQVGPTAEFSVPLIGFGVSVSALYGHKEYKIEDKEADLSLSDYNYISIPVYLKQRIGLGPIPVGIFITGGVYGNVKIGGDGESNAGDVVDAFKHKNFIWGLGAGAGVNLFKHVDLGLYYRGDLTGNYKNIEGETVENKKSQYWTVGMTYFF